MSHNQLRRLKVSAARYLLTIIADICNHPFAAQELPRLPRQRKRVSRWILPNLFGQDPVTNVLLPLGYQWYGDNNIIPRLHHTGQAAPLRPDQQRGCDRTGCPAPTSPVIFFCCGHSFHSACIAPVCNRCLICEQGLHGALRYKVSTAQQAIFHPDANVGQGEEDSDDDGEEGGDDEDYNGDAVQNMTAAEAAAEIQQLAQASSKPSSSAASLIVMHA